MGDAFLLLRTLNQSDTQSVSPSAHIWSLGPGLTAAEAGNAGEHVTIWRALLPLP